jgi:acetoin utilization protein AcuB
MTVQDILSPDLDPLATTDTVADALVHFAGSDVEHLPVVNEDGRLAALVSEVELEEQADPTALLETLGGLGAISVGPDVHLFEAASLLAAHHLSVLPVADAEGRYVGVVERHAVFEHFAQMLSTGTPGAILILEVSPRDYSLGRLSYLIEQTDAKVLSVSTQTPDEAAFDPSVLRITLKLSVTDTSRVRYLLEQNGYRVVAAFNEEDTEEEFSHRLQEFMRYLEV